MKTLALIYASEGTGHKSAAFALREAFLAANPEGNALCLDILDFVPPFMKGLLSGGYDVMARSAPWLWSRFYWGSDKRGGQASAFEWVHGQFCRACLPKLRRHLASKGAEAAIFTHYFGAAEFAAMNRGRAPVYYADTDFETHRFQRSREFTMSFAGSARAARQRMAEGITNVIATGVPVALKYARIPSKAEARAALGLPAGEKIVLVSGGGIGAGPVQKAAESLAAAGYYVLAVCGGNEKLRASMKAFFMYKENVRVEGFVGRRRSNEARRPLGLRGALRRAADAAHRPDTGTGGAQPLLPRRKRSRPPARNPAARRRSRRRNIRKRRSRQNARMRPLHSPPPRRRGDNRHSDAGRRGVVGSKAGAKSPISHTI